MSEKYYEFATYNEAQFDELFLEITGTASSPDTIPDRAVENTEYFQHSPVRGEFLLTDEEAEALKTDARIKYVQLSPDKYPDIFNATDDDLRMDITGDAYERYDDPVKNYHFWANNGAILGSFGSGVADLNHASGQLLRMGQQRNNWISSSTSVTTPISDTITQKGAGENVDVICADNGTWIGHVEFINTGVTNAVNPRDYTGGNLLPGNGYCDVLDVVLDGPYYIDPDWFNAGADPEYNNGAIIDVVGDGSDFFKREVTVNGVRIMGAGTVGGQTAVPDAWLEKVARMFELFTDPNGSGINETFQRNLIKNLSGDAETYHAGFPTIQRVARGAGADYTPNFLTDQGVIDWNLTNLFDTHVQNDMVWYLNSTGDGYGDGDTDAQEVIEHVFHTLHMHGLPAEDIKLYPQISSDWQSGDLYAAMVEAYDAGKWDPSGYQLNPDDFKTDADAFEVAAKEYLYLLNFCMFEYTELWEGGSLAPEWSDDMRTQAGILANNPLGYAFHNTYIATVISKPSLATIRSIFQDGNTPAQDDPSLAGASGYVVDPVRLETRWDGTIVPVESVARAWWGNSSQRSAAFSSIGTVTISSLYTRDGVHGSNTTYPTTAAATHGTQCASLIYGRTHGWAYNCNKWHINLYGSGNAGTIERGFDIVKLFHQNKPNNTTYGTKDPTLMSNSWGYRAGKSGTHYYHRNSGPVAYGGSSDEPEFIRYMGIDGDSGRWKSEFYDNSMTQAGEELTDSGVIFVAAAGNSAQKQVNPDHPDYNNRIALNNTSGLYQTTFSSFGYSVTGTTNRRGFPQHIGKSASQSFQGDDVDFPAINVGALDDVFVSNKESKVNYSDMGNAIDIYAPADGTLAATVGLYGTDVARYDDTYNDLSVQYDCRDTRFSGTSAACPVACGFLATIMQYNRGWTYSDLRNWIQTNVQSVDPDEFNVGAEETDPEGSGWSNRTLPQAQSSEIRVLYLADFDISTPNPTLSRTFTFGGNIAFRNGVIFKRRSK
jgi:hypothetical protein